MIWTAPSGSTETSRGKVRQPAQVRLERGSEIWVITGDFKRDPDPTCAPFEPLRCHTLVTESTFGLPVFRWPDPETVMADIRAWWRRNAAEGKPSLLFAYALGKAQRILAGLDAAAGPIFTHGAVEPIVQVYREAGGAERIRVTHGYAAEMVRFLREKGLSAEAVPNAFSGETEAPDA